MDEAQIKIKERLLKMTEIIAEETQEELDLARAMDDQEIIFRMEAKLEALRSSIAVFNQAMQADTLEAFKLAFDKAMLVRKQSLEQAIKQSKAEKNSRQVIYYQIQLSVAEGPIEGTVKGVYKRLKEDACQV